MRVRVLVQMLVQVKVQMQAGWMEQVSTPMQMQMTMAPEE